MPGIDFDPQGALLRLVRIAKKDTGQSKVVANFLLAWWNAKTYGGFDLAEIGCVDSDIVADMVRILEFIASSTGQYPDCPEREADLQAIIAQHR